MREQNRAAIEVKAYLGRWKRSRASGFRAGSSTCWAKKRRCWDEKSWRDAPRLMRRWGIATATGSGGAWQ